MFRADAEPKIYRLHNERLKLTYYGSTIQPIEIRFRRHKSDVKHGLCSSKRLFEEGDEVTCDVIEYVDCLKKVTLHKRERYYIENFDCVNKQIPSRTKVEYRHDNKEKFKEYGIKYRHDNKEKFKEYAIQYRQDNKEIMNEIKKQYYQDNKEKITERASQKIECECGSVVSRTNIAVHRKSQKHQKLIIK